MHVEPFFDPSTSSLSYVVHDGRTGVVIDPVRDYDARSGRTSRSSMEAVAAYIDRQKLAIPYAIDTHAHADHLSGLPFFRERYGARSVTGARVGEVQRSFATLYGLPAAFPVDGSRERRDASLETPALLLPALQVNIRAGRLPEPEANGISYLKIPLDVLGKSTVPVSLGELVEQIIAWTAQVRAEDPVAVEARFERLLAAHGSTRRAPTRNAVDALLGAIERELEETAEPPPDLDLSLHSFRRWLAAF